MNGARFALRCVIVCLLSNRALLEALPSRADESKRNGSNLVIDKEDSAVSRRWFEPVAGLKVNYVNKELIVKYSPRGKQENAVESRRHDNDEQPTIMQRIGKFMMMIPVGMQLLQLPMAVASIKMSLLKSLLVAKVALFMLFLRSLFMPRTKERIVIVRAPQKEYHEHYYHNPFEDPEDNKPGWLGKPSWLD